MSRYSAAVLDALPLAGAEWQAIRAAELAALGADAYEPWAPYPHQVPPPGDWDLWLLLAGRGAGKTDAAASYTDAHMTGPPCLPGLPGGHRAAIVAPTLGDATEACVNGPSGLRRHNPRVRLVNRMGGTFVVWPSGAEVKLFGAFTPEDVERLRAGGNRCVTGDTLVRTTGGLRPIREIAAGDLVITRNGARRVLRAGMTEPGARLWRLETDHGDVLFATADHEVLTGRGWLPVRVLRPGDTLATWQHHDSSTSLSTTASASTKCGTDTTSPADAGCCIGTSGSASAGRFRPAGIFTTDSTGTRRRLTPIGSNAYRRSSINMNTREPTSGIATEDGRPGLLDAPSRWSVLAAASASSLGARRRGSVPQRVSSATTPRPGPGGHTRNDCAPCAASDSPPVRSGPSRHAHATVRQCSPTDRVEPVYDLMVEHDHEFFAADIVVSNCMAWAEELMAWAKLDACWDHLQFGLRLGPHPRVVASTTPKPRRLLTELVAAPTTAVTRATTDDNPRLPEPFRRRLERYRGTRLGRQEIGGEILFDVPGALWTYDAIRRDPRPADLARVIVAVDPAASHGEDADETGIVVCGLGVDGRGYVLADRSCRLSPDGWARRVVAAFDEYAADLVVAEVNNGGEMVGATIKTVRRAIPYRAIHASRGKAIRAQPVAALYEQGKVSHCGVYPELEEQLTSWTPESGTSPDRLDALVWALTELLVKEQRGVYVY